MWAQIQRSGTRLWCSAPRICRTDAGYEKSFLASSIMRENQAWVSEKWKRRCDFMLNLYKSFPFS